MASPLRRALTALANRQSLSEDQTAEVFGVVMNGEATPAQIGGLLMGLRAKGETADELAGAVRALRDAMVRVDATHEHLVDTCGTEAGRYRPSTSRPSPRSSRPGQVPPSRSMGIGPYRRDADLLTCWRPSACAISWMRRLRVAC